MNRIHRLRRLAWLCLCCLPILFTGCEPAPVEQDPPGGSLSDEASAREALIVFFERLHAGKYAAAADLYGGSYDIMSEQNPTLDPGDQARLWRAACEINGAQCLQVASAQCVFKPQAPEELFHFAVEFQRDDGSIFSQGPCCGEDEAEGSPKRTFDYRVSQQGEFLYQVLDPPVYVP